jgi:cobyrinic acid a,c-diamide synthase
VLNLCISAVSSNSGKTILTTALLYYYKNKARPYKIGPDYIDPQFHKIVCDTNSINLDSFMMNEAQVKWIFNKYKKEVNICEGVMGFYDGDNKGCSAYSVSKLLNIPTILILDASGSYITISAVLKGLLTYKTNNTIKAIVLNNVSSKMHYNLIKNQIEEDHKDILVLGWIQKNLETLNNTHLGLDLDDKNKIKQISQDVLQNIDIKLLETLKINTNINTNTNDKVPNYPFEVLNPINQHISIVVSKDSFSFLYYDNLEFLKEVFEKVTIINPSCDDTIPNDCDIVYICGGYVETNKAYKSIKNSNNFKNSLKKHSKAKAIYAECAGLLYLGNKVDDMIMSKILDVDFTLDTRFNRLGYYYNQQAIKGHSFHYTKAISLNNAHDILSKDKASKGEYGSWSKDKIFGTYLHTMFRNNIKLIQDKFIYQTNGKYNEIQ